MLTVTANQLVAHAIGDYVLQSDWMATTKTSKSVAALAHVVTYSIPFLYLTLSWKALLFIAGTHFIIDRWRLARYVCWAKNFLAPKWVVMPSGDGSQAGFPPPVRNWSWSFCTATGYPPDRPVWLATWLLIITDNLLHILCNAAALQWLT